MTTDGDSYETVVVGAGLGGLTAGARLAQAGRDVLVLEQHSIPGGCATTFPRLDFDFEVSLHEIDGLDEGDPKREIFDQLHISEELSFEPLPEFYYYERGDREIVMPHDREVTIERLVERFPEEEAGIRRYFDVITSMYEAMQDVPLTGDLSLTDKATFPIRHRTFLRYRNTTVGEFFDETFDDEELKLLLAAVLPYYHDDPYSLSFPVFAVGQATLLAGGGYYIEGGSQALSDHLASVIEDNGGTLEFERLVTDLVVEDGAVTGVRHEHVRTGDEARTETAESVVANAAIPLVADELLPDRYGDRLSEQVGDWEYAPSMTNLYIGFERPPSELGCDHYSTVIQDTAIESLSDVMTYRRGSFGKRTINFVDYSQVEADLAPGEKSVGVLTTLDYLSEWTGLTDAEYREKKARVKEVMLRRLGEKYPRLPDAVEHAELATPKTLQGYTRNPGGTPYGFAFTPSQSGLDRQIEPPVEDLEFASVWTYPGGGFTGATIAGYRAAESLLSN